MTEDVASHRVYAGGFVVLPNSAVNDSRLSFRARGLLAYMLGRPPGWSYNADRLAATTTEGRDAVRAAMRELTRLGYYRATRVRLERGRFLTITEVAQSPDLMPPSAVTGGGFPAAGQPTPGQPTPGEAAPYVSTESQDRESGRSAEVDRLAEGTR